jgi:hypothetical protein
MTAVASESCPGKAPSAGAPAAGIGAGTAYLPPVWGFVTLTWMRRREYV